MTLYVLRVLRKSGEEIRLFARRKIVEAELGAAKGDKSVMAAWVEEKEVEL